jgi:Cyclin, N-terminal domain/Cyclin, C-terminal domain
MNMSRRTLLPLVTMSQCMRENDLAPLIGIRITKSDSIIYLLYDADQDESSEVISLMREQDVHYKCRDYFSLLAQSGEMDVDPVCREKMCEWCYRVCDCGIFPCDREMVAVAISYLDRFMLRRQSCDRSTFKLAAVTSFYLATKILSCMQIKIESLVELGRGSFDGNDIQNMECELLEKLSWRLNPPTCQAFVRQLFSKIPRSLDHIQRKTIYDRACFFAELSVYDYGFVSKERYMVAVACLLNALETHQDSFSCDQQQSIEIKEKSSVLAIGLDRQVLERAQAQLWYLYSCSAQLQDEAEIVPLDYFEKHTRNIRTRTSKSCHRQSPVSVRLNNRVSL